MEAQAGVFVPSFWGRIAPNGEKIPGSQLDVTPGCAQVASRSRWVVQPQEGNDVDGVSTKQG